MDATGGWEFRERSEAALLEVGLPDPGQVVGTMSGGQKRRVALAAAVLARPDLLIADEPTNHMDYRVTPCPLPPGSPPPQIPSRASARLPATIPASLPGSARCLQRPI